ncbi:DUF2537 domain-containing protein [Rhodococcus sp. HNM0569]|uniref:DUF2537 domain-containing protein n=1 Tax=Rhodococcus sp. HNM0569 TaxID=2716340 RepID=UPI00146E91C5|nr:DUF2537 domain-containing protein [Rhodococcus sp. HNM0569]
MSAPVRTGETPWFTGLLVTLLTAFFVAAAAVAFAAGLARVNVVMSILLNAAVAAGAAPMLWQIRRTLVWRWVALGGAVGLVAGWIAALAGMG